MLWVTITTVYCLLRSKMRSSIFAVAIGSRAEHGSSIRSTSARAFGIVSCIRFRHRIRVDFPQPDGPMIAVTSCSAKSIVMSRIAFFEPYHADSPLISIFAAMLDSLPHGPQVDDHAGRDADQ